MAEPEDEDSWLYGSSDDKAKGEDVKPAKIAVKQEKDAEAPIVDVVFHSGASNSADNTKTAEESLKQTETKTEPPAVNGDSAEGKSEGTTNESSAKEKSTEEPMEQGASGEQEPEASGESEKASGEKKTSKDGEKEAEDSDDSDDDVQVTIGAITSGAAPGTEGGAGGQLGGGGRTFYRTPVQVINTPKSTAATKGLDMLAPGSINGQAVIDFNIDLIEDKPWRKPGADISDYFNYGFNEVSWKLYCEKQKRLRSGGGMDVNYVAPAQSTSSSTPNGKTSTPAQTAMASILGSYEKYHATATPSAPQQQQQTKTPVRVNVPPPCTKQFTKTVQSISTLGFSRRSSLLLETSPVGSASPGAVQQQPVQSMTPGPPPQAQTPATSPLFSIPPPVNGPPALPLQFDPTKPPPSLPIGIPPPGYPPPGTQGLLPPGIHPPGTEYSIQLPPSNPPQFIPPSSFMVPPQQQAPPAQSSQQFGGAFSREEEEAAANQLAQMERERRGRSEDERDRYPTSDDDRATTDRYPPPADHRSGGRDRGGDRGRDYDRDRYERSRRGLDYRDRDDYREADRARDRESRTREGRDYDRGSDRRGSDRDRDRERSRRRDESPPRESGSSTRERHKGTRRKYDGDGDGERKHKKAKKHKSSRGEKPPGGASGDESANNSQNIDHDNIVVKRERDT